MCFETVFSYLGSPRPIVQLVVQAPTYRTVTSKPDRYVISCEDDGTIWRAISENDVPIYTKELILTGILKQEIAWDDHEFMVPGSYN